jgi:hypothetical protein
MPQIMKAWSSLAGTGMQPNGSHQRQESGDDGGIIQGTAAQRDKYMLVGGTHAGTLLKVTR